MSPSSGEYVRLHRKMDTEWHHYTLWNDLIICCIWSCIVNYFVGGSSADIKSQCGIYCSRNKHGFLYYYCSMNNEKWNKWKLQLEIRPDKMYGCHSLTSVTNYCLKSTELLILFPISKFPNTLNYRWRHKLMYKTLENVNTLYLFTSEWYKVASVKCW